jgi:hypothetical protein
MLIKVAQLEAIERLETEKLVAEGAQQCEPAPLEAIERLEAINVTQLLRAKGNMEEAYKRRLRAELAKQNGLRLEIAQLVRTKVNMEASYRKRLRAEGEARGALQKELTRVASMWSE